MVASQRHQQNPGDRGLGRGRNRGAGVEYGGVDDGCAGTLEEDEAITLSFTPHLHMMFTARSTSCCPQLFERASSTWWNPKLVFFIFNL